MAVNNVLSLDVGNKRIGVAIGNTLARIASPLTTIQNTTDVYKTLATMVRSNEVQLVVIGLPRDQHGNQTEQSNITKRFADDLAHYISVPIEFQDESLTSVMAEERLQHKGAAPSKEAIDAEAAAIILSDYFARMESSHA